jgi:hypothetical protein
MKNLYDKGRFRSYAYGKIPPYLKKIGNKKWRRTAPNTAHALSNAPSFETNITLPPKTAKRNERIKVKLIFIESPERTTSRYVTYRNLKALEDSLKRARVVRVVFKTKSQQPLTLNKKYELY